MSQINVMQSIFSKIEQTDSSGNVFWKSRELSSSLGYSEYSKFKRIIDLAKQICKENGHEIADNFTPVGEMVKLGSGASRKVENLNLSRYACLLISTKADGRKELVKQAREFFSGKLDNEQGLDIRENADIIFYSNPEGNLRVELTFDGETFWTTQKRMAEIFNVEVPTINYHLAEIFKSGELNKYSVIRKIRITAGDAKQYDTKFYNLDAIIAIGYRVNSTKATQFRIWATQVLSEFIRKGFVMDDERFKKGDKWSNEHFELVLERIRDIRSSERMLYQKITDIYSTADDYQTDSLITKEFYSKVQNKLHWAISGHTAAEIIYKNADATKLNMGLTTWKLAPEGKVLKSDVVVAKNYLSETHIKELNQIVSAYLDLAENRAKRKITTTMEDWAKFLDSFLDLSSYPILLDKGKISAEQAKIKAFEEYNKFRVTQDRDYLSDFDKERKQIEKKVK